MEDGGDRLTRRSLLAASAGALAAAAVARTTVQEPAALAATTPPVVAGTDVSNQTTVTNWPQVKAAGMSFVGVMAYDGASVSNPSYASQVTGALSAGLFVMPYVVADPLKVATGGHQFSDKAWAVIDSIATAPYVRGARYLPIALDLESRRGLPVAIAHGTPDPVISVELAREARDRLEDAGLRVVYRESAMGHTIDPRMLPELQSWLASVTAADGSPPAVTARSARDRS